MLAPVCADRLIDGDYQDGRALEFGGRKTGVVLGKVLAAKLGPCSMLLKMK